MAMLEGFRERAEELRVVNIRVYVGGKPVAGEDWDGEIRRNQYSVSKSFTSAAVGIAQREGLLSLSERVAEAFREEMPSEPGQYLEQLTVRDLLTMCAGQETAQLMGEQRPQIPEENWVRYVLARPFSHKPGTRFLYNNAGPYLAGILVQRRAGCNLVDYLMPRLFAPLGITRPVWECDPAGNTFGAGGLFLTVSEVARFAQLHLQKGQWEGRQLVPQEWVETATAKQVENGGEGYGFLFWRGPDNSYRCDGKYGQYGIVLPERDAVIAVNAECREQHKLLAWIHETVVPEL